LTLSLDRYQTVTGKPAPGAAAATAIAQAMEDYEYPPRPDLKPYAEKLRE
jgi:hypothetical protein